MKYLMARDAGIEAAEYVIQQWPELFPSRDFSPVSCKVVIQKFICYIYYRILDQGDTWNKKVVKLLYNVCKYRIARNIDGK